MVSFQEVTIFAKYTDFLQKMLTVAKLREPWNYRLYFLKLQQRYYDFL